MSMSGTRSGKHGEECRCSCGAKRQAQDRAQRRVRSTYVEVSHNPAPTSTLPPRLAGLVPRDSARLSLYRLLVPLCFASGCNQVSHQPQSPQQAKFAGVHNIFDGVPNPSTHAYQSARLSLNHYKGCLASLCQTPSSKSNTDWPDRDWFDLASHSWNYLPRQFSFHSPSSPPPWYCLRLSLG